MIAVLFVRPVTLLPMTELQNGIYEVSTKTEALNYSWYADWKRL